MAKAADPDYLVQSEGILHCLVCDSNTQIFTGFTVQIDQVKFVGSTFTHSSHVSVPIQRNFTRVQNLTNTELNDMRKIICLKKSEVYV